METTTVGYIGVIHSLHYRAPFLITPTTATKQQADRVGKASKINP